MSKPVGLESLGAAYLVPEFRVGDIRRKGGVSLVWALWWNYRNQGFDVKGEAQVRKLIRVRVPMRSTGADQPVVVLKWL